MRTFIAIFALVAVSALMVAVEGHLERASNKVAYDVQEYEERIWASMAKVTQLATECSDKYLESTGGPLEGSGGAGASTQPSVASWRAGISRSDAAVGKFALAAQLMNSVGSVRHLRMLEALQGLRGLDYAREMQAILEACERADAEVDGRLESLVKLAPELPASGIYTDVARLVRSMKENRIFLLGLLHKVPTGGAH